MRKKHSESLAMSHRQNGDKGSSQRGSSGGAVGGKTQWQLHRVAVAVVVVVVVVADVMHKI